MEVLTLILYALFIIQSVIFIVAGILIVRKLTEKPVEQPLPLSRLFNNFKRSDLKETEEERRLRIINENIENYDGSGKNQVKL